jgi:hypothetical protein
MLTDLYKIEKVPIEQLSHNLNNPRIITSDKFEKLVESLVHAPWMMKLRPIVVNKENIIIGGNQRFDAAIECGWTHVYVIRADKITDEQEKRFILRDNIDFGKWDLEIINRVYSQKELLEYGFDIQLLDMVSPKVDQPVVAPKPMGDDEVEEPDISEEDMAESKKDYNDNTIKQIVFQLPSELYEEVLKDMDEISKRLDLDDNSEVLLHLINFYEVANGLSDSDNDSD